MRPDDRTSGDPVSRGPTLARYLEATFFHHALQETPYSGFAYIPRSAFPDGMASGARVLADKIENILIRQGHETIIRNHETIMVLIRIGLSTVQVFVSHILQRSKWQEGEVAVNGSAAR